MPAADVPLSEAATVEAADADEKPGEAAIASLVASSASRVVDGSVQCSSSASVVQCSSVRSAA
jgi:hypothetical protein